MVRVRGRDWCCPGRGVIATPGFACDSISTTPTLGNDFEPRIHRHPEVRHLTLVNPFGVLPPPVTVQNAGRCPRMLYRLAAAIVFADPFVVEPSTGRCAARIWSKRPPHRIDQAKNSIRVSSALPAALLYEARAESAPQSLDVMIFQSGAGNSLQSGGVRRFGSP